MSDSEAANRVAAGEPLRHFRLPAIDGSEFDSRSLHGRRAMVSFFRFAACPFCNFRVNELVTRFDELDGKLDIVAIFESPLDNLQRHAGRHAAPFPIVADESRSVYDRYAIEKSVGGMMKGMVMRAPTLMKSMASGFVPTSLKGSLFSMPAEFLVNEAGTVQRVHYGQDEGDHLPFEALIDFANG